MLHFSLTQNLYKRLTGFFYRSWTSGVPNWSLFTIRLSDHLIYWAYSRDKYIQNTVTSILETRAETLHQTTHDQNTLWKKNNFLYLSTDSESHFSKTKYNGNYEKAISPLGRIGATEYRAGIVPYNVGLWTLRNRPASCWHFSSVHGNVSHSTTKPTVQGAE